MLASEHLLKCMYAYCIESISLHAHSVGGTEVSTSCFVLLCITMACKRHLQCPLQAIVKQNMHVCVYLYCGTCSRSGPNLRGPREPLGQWREMPMLLAASTMERRTLSCWSLEEWITMATLCRMHGSWMSPLGGGGRQVVMNI